MRVTYFLYLCHSRVPGVIGTARVFNAILEISMNIMAWQFKPMSELLNMSEILLIGSSLGSRYMDPLITNGTLS